MDKRSQTDNNANTDADTERVGARQAALPSFPQGGEYLNVYPIFKLAEAQKNERDPRLLEFREMGIHHAWQKVAEAIGVDAFLKMWRILDAEPQFYNEKKGQLTFSFRQYRSYQRYQRDRLMADYARNGFTSKQIQAKIETALCEKITTSQIWGIIKKGKIKHD